MQTSNSLVPNLEQESETLFDEIWNTFEESIPKAFQLLSEAKTAIHNEQQGWYYRILETALLTKEEKFNEALPIASELTEVHSSLNNKWRIRSSSTLGVLYTFIDESGKGLAYLEEMWELSIQEKDAHNEALALHDIAALFDKDEYYDQAKKIWQRTSYTLGIISCLRNKAFTLLRNTSEPTRTEIQEALDLAQEALILAEQKGSQHWQANCHTILAEAYAQQANEEQSLKHLNLCKQCYENAGITNSSIRLLNETKIFYILKDYQAAIASAQETLNSPDAKDRQMKAYDLLSKSYAAINDYEQAYNAQINYNKAKDEHYNEDNTKKIRTLEVLHDTTLAKQKATLEQEKAQALQIYIDQLEGLNSEILELSLRDPLTNLFNRRHLMHELSFLTETAKRYKRDLSLVILDADHFKQVNDTFGHTVGDDVLKVIAEILQAEPRKSDLAARYGGEEFVLVLTETNVKQAMFLCERIRTKVEHYPWHTIADTLTVTISIGISQLNPTLSPEDLLKSADSKLYQAKHNGRNCIVA